MDLVYLVRTGDDNKPLRYSLRSVAQHIPDVRVIIAGHKPRWVKNVTHFPVPQPVRHHRNQVKILKAICTEDSGLPEDFVLMNDDFFLLRPITETPALAHRGPIEDLKARASWQRGFYGQSLDNTIEILETFNISRPLLAFDGIHTPMPVEKTRMRAALHVAGAKDVQHRSLYGNLMMSDLDVVEGEDVKVRLASKRLPDTDWMSVSRGAWKGGVHRLMAKTFPEKCRFEV